MSWRRCCPGVMLHMQLQRMSTSLPQCEPCCPAQMHQYQPRAPSRCHPCLHTSNHVLVAALLCLGTGNMPCRALARSTQLGLQDSSSATSQHPHNTFLAVLPAIKAPSQDHHSSYFYYQMATNILCQHAALELHYGETARSALSVRHAAVKPHTTSCLQAPVHHMVPHSFAVACDSEGDSHAFLFKGHSQLLLPFCVGPSNNLCLAGWLDCFVEQQTPTCSPCLACIECSRPSCRNHPLLRQCPRPPGHLPAHPTQLQTVAAVTQVRSCLKGNLSCGGQRRPRPPAPPQHKSAQLQAMSPGDSNVLLSVQGTSSARPASRRGSSAPRGARSAAQIRASLSAALWLRRWTPALTCHQVGSSNPSLLHAAWSQSYPKGLVRPSHAIRTSSQNPFCCTQLPLE